MIGLANFVYPSTTIDPAYSSVHKFAAVAAKAEDVFPASSDPPAKYVSTLATATLRAAALIGYRTPVEGRMVPYEHRQLYQLLEDRTRTMLAGEIRSRLRALRAGTTRRPRPTMRPINANQPEIRALFDRLETPERVQFELIEHFNAASVRAAHQVVLNEAIRELRRFNSWAITEIAELLERLILTNPGIFRSMSDEELLQDTAFEVGQI